jgi:3-oxosteroid 1-dehydrogenase
MSEWHETVDLLVVGSGAAGLAAALRGADAGLSALVVEKSAVWGGSMAMSAGALWVPCNPQMKAAGIDDSVDDAVRYLKSVTFGEVDEERLVAFVTGAVQMVEWLQEHSDVTFSSLVHYPDYNTDVDGSRPGGRSLEPDAFDARALGDAFATLHGPYPGTLIMGKFLMRIPEARELLMPGLKPKLGLARGFVRYLRRGRARRSLGRDPYLTMGQALAGRLRLSLNKRGVPIWTSSPVVSLVEGNGRISGAVVERNGTTVRIEATAGVVIASGGFERSAELRERYQGAGDAAAWSAGHEGNTGDGIRLGEQAGAMIDTELMREAWWTPAVLPPGSGASVLVIEKSLPHGMFVGRDGNRFVNEAANYNDVGRAMYEAEAVGGGGVPAWWVLDATYRKRFIIGPVGPGFMMPDRKLPSRFQPGNGWLYKADTLDELATQIGVDSETLAKTVARFNQNATHGDDPDFHRGQTANDLYYSDPRVAPNPSLGPVATAPFYAVRIYPGDLGTKAGLVTGSDGRVLRPDGSTIDGLFAAGNTASTVMGRSYPGAGATLAPAMLGGFIAAETAAAERRSS